VRDNGIGFDPALKKDKTFGLLGIQERVLMLDGTADIRTAPGRGTEIEVSIPVLSTMRDR
jgi:two-component system sensor histidine kinase DegS